MLRALPAGGTVGVVAPAAPVHNRSDVLRRDSGFWEHHGFCVKLSDSLFHRSGYPQATRGYERPLSLRCSAIPRSTPSRSSGADRAQL